MKKYHFYCGLYWGILGGLVIGTALKLSLETLKYSGPGFFPLIIGVLLLAL